MELGIGMFGDLALNGRTGTFQSVSQRLNELIEQVKLADELGIDIFSMGEHHRRDFAVSSPETILAALSTVTKNIKLTSGVTVLSTADPVKIYEEFATVDLLSKGRSEIIAGRGGFIESFQVYGYDLENYNELFEEKLELLLKLNNQEIVTWKGKFRPPLENISVYPRAERKIPIWLAVGKSIDSASRAAKLGLPMILGTIGSSIAHSKPIIDFYVEQYKKFGHDEKKMQIGVQTHSFVADSQTELLESYYPHYAAKVDVNRKVPNQQMYTKNDFLNDIGPNGPLFMGNSEQVAEKISSTIQTLKLTRFIAHIDVGGPSHKQIMKAIELYARKVIPKIKLRIQ